MSGRVTDDALSWPCPACDRPQGAPCTSEPTCEARVVQAVKRGRNPLYEGKAKPKRGGKWAGVNEARAKRKAAGTPHDGYDSAAERRYAGRLELRWRAGEVDYYDAHPGSLAIAKGSRYQPDFLVVESGTIYVDEVKGKRGWKLSAKGHARWKDAAERHRWATFRAAIWTGTGWRFERYEPQRPWRVRPEPACSRCRDTGRIHDGFSGGSEPCGCVLGGGER